MSSEHAGRGRLARGADVRAVGTIVLGGLAVLFAFTALYVAAFHAPRPKGYDVGVVGTPAQAASVQAALDATRRGAYDVRRYAGERDAREALLDTDVHGVVVSGRPRDRILVAQALGAAPTQAVTAALQRAALALSGTPASVQDLRPLPASDERGLSPLFTVVGTLIPSLVLGVLLSVFGRACPAHVRWVAIVVYALLAGVVAAFNVVVLVGALAGHFVGIAVVCALLALAVSAAAHGLGHLGGPRGIVAAVLLMMLLGVSSAGGAVSYQFEPGFYGALSQLLPPGAALTSVRNVQYFDSANTLTPLAVLGAWAFAGLALGLAGERYGVHVRRAGATATATARPA